MMQTTNNSTTTPQPRDPSEADPLYRLSSEMSLFRERLLDELDALAAANTRPGSGNFTDDLQRLTEGIDEMLGQVECDLDAASGTHRVKWLLGEIVTPEAATAPANADTPEPPKPAEAGSNGRPGFEVLQR